MLLIGRMLHAFGLSRSGGDLVMAGCLYSQFSWDTRFRGRPNGAFTYYALKTLREVTSPLALLAPPPPP